MSPDCAPGDLDPAVCFGAVMHERHVSASNRFVYRSAFMRLPLSQLPLLNRRLFRVEHAGVFSFQSRDHGLRDGSCLQSWIRGLLDEHHLADVADGEIVLHTMPRMFGFVFNPVSFWYCHDKSGALRAVLAEVNNTFGETHRYLIHHSDRRPIASGEELKAHKVFHVSPFFPVSGEYRFRFEFRKGFHAVSIDYYDHGVKQLSTRVGGHAQALEAPALRRWLISLPLMTFGVVARIHWQALRLWLRKVRFHRKPSPPLEETTT